MWEYHVYVLFQVKLHVPVTTFWNVLTLLNIVCRIWAPRVNCNFLINNAGDILLSYLTSYTWC